MAGVVVVVSNGCRGGNGNGNGKKARGEMEGSTTAQLMAAIRKSMIYCHRLNGSSNSSSSLKEEDDVTVTASASAADDGMDIGWPTEVRHVTHVTFNRHNGFLGLPVEFQLEVPCRAPSASASVFGVSAELMQCGFDCKGNSVPIILLQMQERLYSLGGLKAEGIFRINPENNEEKDLRNQLNRGVIPDDIDVHCLAGLIKACFRELPEGVLDSLSPAQVLQCENEEDCVELVKVLPPMQFALVKWVVDLMADVVEEEEINKMNARNIAMVFAPNMTQLSDPLTSLMHAVQVMNLLQTLIFRTLRERDEDEGATDKDWSFSFSPSVDSNGRESDELRESRSEDDYKGEIVEETEEIFLRHFELDLGDQATRFSCSQWSISDSSIVTSDNNPNNGSSRTIDCIEDSIDTEPTESVEDDATTSSCTNHSNNSRATNDADSVVTTNPEDGKVSEIVGRGGFKPLLRRLVRVRLSKSFLVVWLLSSFFVSKLVSHLLGQSHKNR